MPQHVPVVTREYEESFVHEHDASIEREHSDILKGDFGISLAECECFVSGRLKDHANVLHALPVNVCHSLRVLFKVGLHRPNKQVPIAFYMANLSVGAINLPCKQRF